MNTTTQETAQALLCLAAKVEALGMDGIRLSFVDVRGFNRELERRNVFVSVDEKNIHRATHLTIDHYGKWVQASVEIDAHMSVPVLILRDISTCTLDHTWTRIARAARNLPMPLRKELFAAMSQYRERELEEKRAKMDILAHKLAELQEVL